MMSSPLHQSRQGCPMLKRSKKPIYIYISKGAVEFIGKAPSFNLTCTLWCSPKVKPYINYVGMSKTKQEHDLPEVAMCQQCHEEYPSSDFVRDTFM